MAMPPGSAEQASSFESPPLQNAHASFYDEDEQGEAPSLGATQIFGISPSDEMHGLLFPSSSGKGFEHGPAAQMPSRATSSPGIYANEANEVAYFDFGAADLKEGSSGSPFVRASLASSKELPAEKPSIPPAPQPFAASVRQTPPAPKRAQQAKPLSVPNVVEPTPAPGQQSFTSKLPLAVDDMQLAENEQAEPLFELQQGFAADLPQDVVDEIRRVEDEQAAQLYQFHQSEEFLKPKRKGKWLVAIVVFLVVILTAFASLWLLLGYTPQRVLLEVQRLFSLKP
jgi:hypothetical protein